MKLSNIITSMLLSAALLTVSGCELTQPNSAARDFSAKLDAAISEMSTDTDTFRLVICRTQSCLSALEFSVRYDMVNPSVFSHINQISYLSNKDQIITPVTTKPKMTWEVFEHGIMISITPPQRCCQQKDQFGFSMNMTDLVDMTNIVSGNEQFPLHQPINIEIDQQIKIGKGENIVLRSGDYLIGIVRS